jgi:hypothetical protein
MRLEGKSSGASKPKKRKFLSQNPTTDKKEGKSVGLYGDSSRYPKKIPLSGQKPFSAFAVSNAGQQT